MAQVQLTFPATNYSLQIGDTAYYASVQSSGGFDVTSSNITEIGFVNNVDIENNGSVTVTCDIGDDTLTPPNGSYIFFSKENIANLTSILGYYGEVEFRNDSKDKAELFATACEISQSSK